MGTHGRTLALTAALVLTAAAPAVAATTTFDTTGEHPYVVPAGVTELQVTLVGGRGGDAGATGKGGAGAVVTATIAATPGETLYARVGGNGTYGDGAAAFNGGGASGLPGEVHGGGGGGATDLRRLPGTAEGSGSSRVLVAGGGGGIGARVNGPGGYRGGAAGEAGVGIGGSGGKAGTMTADGEGGTSASGCSAAAYRDDSVSSVPTAVSGAGGGGLYGGGCGENNISSPSGGGGGSSLAPGGTVALDATGVPLVRIVTADPPAPPAPPAPSGPSGAGTPVAPAPAADTTPPVLAKVGLTNTRFRITARPKGAPKDVKRGSELFVSLSEAASVQLTVTQLRPGRRVGKRCKAPSRRNRSRRACTRVSPVGTATLPLAAGLQTVALPTTYLGGRLSRGRFRVTLVATDATGNRSAPASTAFTVVR